MSAFILGTVIVVVAAPFVGLLLLWLGGTGQLALKRFATSLPEVAQFAGGNLSSPENARRAVAVLSDIVAKAQARYDRTGRPVSIRTSFRHRAKSWPHPRRILVKIDVTAQGQNVRFMVTNRRGRAADLVAWYDDRGASENWIKELKLDIHADRLSCHRFRANAFRLQLHSIALLLLAYFRRCVLAGTRLATATIGTIRLQLLKVAGRVRRSVRRLWFHLASHWPGQSLFAVCHRALARAPT